MTECLCVNKHQLVTPNWLRKSGKSPGELGIGA